MNILAVDVDYRPDKAVAAGILFRAWGDSVPLQEISIICEIVDEYVPGKSEHSGS